MRIFFALAPHFSGNPEYEASVRKMAATFNFQPVFAHETPAAGNPSEWINTALIDCQFAFFDITGFDASVAYAFGVASQNADVFSILLIDRVEHNKSNKGSGDAIADALLAKAQTFNGADDFQRQAHLHIDKAMGVKVMQDQRLVARIKDEIAKKGPLYIRQLANGIGRPIGDVQPIVYGLVRNGEVRKTGETSGSQYSKPN